jgi:DNA polymerase-3 subunit gamma/tau
LVEGRLVHAYLFSGPRGTGKTSTARVFAKALNCLALAGGEPCNACSNCEAINRGAFLDLLEIDAASHRRIDDVRELQERLPFGPVQGRYKVYIIDEVHMLTPEAFNALLKTLEDPPPHVVFILATTEPQRIPQTVLSRCLRFDFRPLSVKEISAYLQEVAKALEITVEERAAWAIARLARGSLRDALSLLEECAAYTDARLSEEDVRLVLGLLAEEEVLALGEALWQRNYGQLMGLLSKAWDHGKQPVEVVRELLGYLRDLLVVKLCPERLELLNLFPESSRELFRHLHLASPKRVWEAVRVLTEVEGQLRFTAQPEILVELALLEIAEGDAEQEQATRVEERRGEIDEIGKTPGGGTPPLHPLPPQKALGSAEVEPVCERRDGWTAVERVSWWPQLMELTRRQPKLRALLGGVKAMSLEGDRVRLAVTSQFHLEELAQPKTKAVVEALLDKVMKRPVVVELVMEERGAEVGAPKEPKEKEREMLEEALRVFGGSVLDTLEED